MGKDTCYCIKLWSAQQQKTFYLGRKTYLYNKVFTVVDKQRLASRWRRKSSALKALQSFPPEDFAIAMTNLKASEIKYFTYEVLLEYLGYSCHIDRLGVTKQGRVRSPSSPVYGFKPNREVRMFLEKQRLPGESNSQLLNRLIYQKMAESYGKTTSK